MRYDLHVHSSYSGDTITTPATVLKTAENKGIGIAVTEHNTTASWKRFRALEKKHNAPVIYGEEVSSVDGKGRNAGHITGLFLTQEIRSRHYREVIDEIKAQGGLSSVAHPYDIFRHPCPFLEEIKNRVDLIEAFNSRCYLQLFNSRAQAFAQRNGIPASAGSDSHTPEEIGCAWVECTGDSLEGLRKALARGKTSFGGRLTGLRPHIITALRTTGLSSEV
jgi:predicted metal-dependent phosphoesterase TrpH